MRNAVPAVLGHSSAAYRIRGGASGLYGRNPAQHLRIGFSIHGVSLHTSGEALTLSLAAVGRGTTLRPLPAAAPHASSNRVVYRRGNLSEWYVNGPLGLEQGFTLAAPPGPPQAGPLTLALHVSGRLARSARALRGAIRFGRLTYGRLRVRDARGRVVPSRLELRNGRVLLRVDDRTARYPLTVDPSVTNAYALQNELTASDGIMNDGFGTTVAIDGTTLVVGAPAASVGGNAGQGKVYVFEFASGKWSQTATLTASDGASGDSLGVSVAVSGDTIVAGSSNQVIGGAVYVFTKPASGWVDETETAKLTAAQAPQNADRFATAVAIDGSTIAVGAPGVTEGSTVKGAVWVYEKSGGSWGSPTELANTNSGQGELGSSVAISGGTIVAGDPVYSSNKGALYVFESSGGSWSQTARLTASDAASFDSLGRNVAFDGSTIVGGTNGHPAAYVFEKPTAGWANATETVELTSGSGNSQDEFGHSVAVSGTTIAVGAPSYEYPGTSASFGGVYVFELSGGTWTRTTPVLFPSPTLFPTGSGFGDSTAMSAGAIVTGAPDADAPATSQGAALVYASSSGGSSASTPTVTIPSSSDQSILEGNSGTTDVQIPVHVDVPPSSDLTVSYSVSGTATRGSDFTTAGTVTMPANALGTTALIHISVIGDTTVEPDETVTVTLSSGSGYTVGSPDSATVTILNDDSAGGSGTGSGSGSGSGSGTGTGSGSGSTTINQQCGSPAVPPCWTTFTINGNSPPAGVELQLFMSGGIMQVQVQDTNASDPNELGADVPTGATVHAVLDLGSYDPVVFAGTGLVTAYSETLGSPNTATFDARPRASSWANSGCTLTSCGTTASPVTADSDYSSLLLAAVDDLSGSG
ncbi:MAG TPA: hypothetical protein VJ986_09690, partial [Gaiellaceae bacterium]|nr:hypothetical protein [Gaiellaceae bacterium]